mgnify:CR=1 FL=1
MSCIIIIHVVDKFENQKKLFFFAVINIFSDLKTLIDSRLFNHLFPQKYRRKAKCANPFSIHRMYYTL